MTDRIHYLGGDNIHRLLDEALTGVAITPDGQDLKEEIRANLALRVAELEAVGQSRAAATHQAFAQLGDVRDLFEAPVAETASVPANWHAVVQRHRVRPKAAFFIGVVVAALATTIGVLLASLGARGVVALPVGAVIALTGIAANGIAWIVGNSLAHESTTNYPMPVRRASAFFLATLLAGYGLGLGWLIALGALPKWVVVFAALCVVAAIVLFAVLGATRTNRQKAWVREFRRGQPAVLNRFQEEPETAARFGIYTIAICVAGFAVFILLGVMTGWAWSWLALPGSFVIMMITLARMLFRPR